jgi:hypothetical protein
LSALRSVGEVGISDVVKPNGVNANGLDVVVVVVVVDTDDGSDDKLGGQHNN